MSGDSLSPIPAQDESSSRFYRVSKDHITGPIENKLRVLVSRSLPAFALVNVLNVFVIFRALNGVVRSHLRAAVEDVQSRRP